MNSTNRTARVAGFLYLTIAVLGIFANFFVLEGLVVPGDAESTANNILANELLFRSGMSSFVIVVVLDLVVVWLLYVLLEPVNRHLSLLAAWFRLIYAAILGVAAGNFLSVLQLLGGADYLSVFEAGQLHAQAMVSLNAFSDTWLVGLVLFGLHLLVLGYLIFKSAFLPRIFGVLLIIADLAYLTDSFAHFLLPNYASYEAIFLPLVAIPSVISELSLTFWLLIKGVNVEQSEKRAAESA